MRRVCSRLALFAVLAASVLGLSAIGATAKTSPTPAKKKPHFVIVTGGTTTLTATTKAAQFLVSHGVTVTPISPATISGATVTLPVKIGAARITKKLDGFLVHAGAVKFATTKRSATVRHITLYRTGKRAWLAGLVNGKAIHLGSISALKASRSGTSATVSGELHLSAQVAHIINKLLGKHLVSAGYDFGSFTSTLTLK
jgi:hypothetical protein